MTLPPRPIHCLTACLDDYRQRPDLHRQSLASAVEVLGLVQLARENYTEALNSALESLSLTRELHQQHPKIFQLDLATRLE